MAKLGHWWLGLSATPSPSDEKWCSFISLVLFNHRSFIKPDPFSLGVRRFSGKIRIPGFGMGKAPLECLESLKACHQRNPKKTIEPQHVHKPNKIASAWLERKGSADRIFESKAKAQNARASSASLCANFGWPSTLEANYA